MENNDAVLHSLDPAMILPSQEQQDEDDRLFAETQLGPLVVNIKRNPALDEHCNKLLTQQLRTKINVPLIIIMENHKMLKQLLVALVIACTGCSAAQESSSVPSNVRPERYEIRVKHCVDNVCDFVAFDGRSKNSYIKKIDLSSRVKSVQENAKADEKAYSNHRNFVYVQRMDIPSEDEVWKELHSSGTE